MKTLTRVVVCLTALTICAEASVAQTNGHSSMAPSAASPGFDKMKTLVGEWEGKNKEGKPVQVSYRLASGGTALEESLRPAGEAEMVTLYSADGSRVALTHYCPTSNQPRMCSAPIHSHPQKIDFSFTGATNLASPATGHMHHLTLQIQDNDHFTQAWTWRENGKHKIDVIHFIRK